MSEGISRLDWGSTKSPAPRVTTPRTLCEGMRADANIDWFAAISNIRDVARDAVKKEALRKAGIGYHEVVAGHTTAGELKRLVEKLVPALGPVEAPPNGL
jgi:hypothetical protein